MAIWLLTFLSLVCVSISESTSASEQMLYDIYENTIGMIEELEKHEDHGKSAGYSGLLSHVIPPNKKKEKQDVSLPALLHLRPTCYRKFCCYFYYHFNYH